MGLWRTVFCQVCCRQVHTRWRLVLSPHTTKGGCVLAYRQCSCFSPMTNQQLAEVESSKEVCGSTRRSRRASSAAVALRLPPYRASGLALPSPTLPGVVEVPHGACQRQSKVLQMLATSAAFPPPVATRSGLSVDRPAWLPLSRAWPGVVRFVLLGAGNIEHVQLHASSPALSPPLAALPLGSSLDDACAVDRADACQTWLEQLENRHDAGAVFALDPTTWDYAQPAARYSELPWGLSFVLCWQLPLPCWRLMRTYERPYVLHGLPWQLEGSCCWSALPCHFRQTSSALGYTSVATIACSHTSCLALMLSNRLAALGPAILFLSATSASLDERKKGHAVLVAEVIVGAAEGSVVDPPWRHGQEEGRDKLASLAAAVLDLAPPAPAADLTSTQTLRSEAACFGALPCRVAAPQRHPRP